MLPINTLNGVELGMEWGKEDHLRSKYFHSLLQQCFTALEVALHLELRVHSVTEHLTAARRIEEAARFDGG